MMAIKRTPQELAYIHHWRKRGYRVNPGEPVPTDTVTPPAHSFMTKADRNRASPTEMAAIESGYGIN